MDTNPQYRPKTDPKVDSDAQYNTTMRTGAGTTGWIIGGLIVLALIAAFFMWGGNEATPPQPTTGTTTEQPATPPATQPQGQGAEQPAPAPEQPAPAPEQPAPQGGTTGQGTTNP